MIADALYRPYRFALADAMKRPPEPQANAVAPKYRVCIGADRIVGRRVPRART